MIDVLNDEVVDLGKNKYHYHNEWYENHGSMPDSVGTVSVSQVDENGKENGLYIRNHYYRTSEAYDEAAFTEICVKKDGKVDGAVYGFSDGKLVQVKIDDKVVTSEDIGFKMYEKTAPKFKDAFKVIKGAKSRIDSKHDNAFISGLKKLKDGILK